MGTNQCRSHWWQASRLATYACPSKRYEQQKFLHHRCRRVAAHQPCCYQCNLWTYTGSIVCTHMGILHTPLGAYRTGIGHERLYPWTNNIGNPSAIRSSCRIRYDTAALIAAESALRSFWNSNSVSKQKTHAHDIQQIGNLPRVTQIASRSETLDPV